MSLSNDLDIFFNTYYAGDNNIREKFTELSKDTFGNSLVNDSTTAINFDYIAGTILSGSNHRSCDALHITNSINFIEFKKNVFGQSKKQIYKRIGIREKMSSSLHMLEKIIFPESNVTNIENIEYKFILVVDHNTDPILTSRAIADQNAGRKHTLSNTEFSHFEVKFTNINGQNKRMFFDFVEVWNDINFSVNLSFL